MARGRSPTKALPLRLSSIKLDKFPTSSGIKPVNKLLDRFSVSSDLRVKMLGKRPWIEFSFNSRDTRDDKDFISLGIIAPERRLACKSIPVTAPSVQDTPNQVQTSAELVQPSFRFQLPPSRVKYIVFKQYRWTISNWSSTLFGSKSGFDVSRAARARNCAVPGVSTEPLNMTVSDKKSNILAYTFVGRTVPVSLGAELVGAALDAGSETGAPTGATVGNIGSTSIGSAVGTGDAVVSAADGVSDSVTDGAGEFVDSDTVGAGDNDDSAFVGTGDRVTESDRDGDPLGIEDGAGLADGSDEGIEDGAGLAEG